MTDGLRGAKMDGPPIIDEARIIEMRDEMRIATDMILGPLQRAVNRRDAIAYPKLTDYGRYRPRGLHPKRFVWRWIVPDPENRAEFKKLQREIEKLVGRYHARERERLVCGNTKPKS